MSAAPKEWVWYCDTPCVMAKWFAAVVISVAAMLSLPATGAFLGPLGAAVLLVAIMIFVILLAMDVHPPDKNGMRGEDRASEEAGR